jgi:imidazoleglycerol-phosphate dehydratase
MKKRSAEITRNTTETQIKLHLVLDGQGKAGIATGFGLADHMLTLLAFWAGFDLSIECSGDLQVDAHHTLEDVGLCLGQALLEALGDRLGMARTGAARVPMDEALVDVCADLSGRSYLVFRGEELLPPTIAGEERDVWREFFKSFASGARMNLHINMLYGVNGHHLLESACKGIGLSLRQAVSKKYDSIMSTKGSLD